MIRYLSKKTNTTIDSMRFTLKNVWGAMDTNEELEHNLQQVCTDVMLYQLIKALLTIEHRHRLTTRRALIIDELEQCLQVFLDSSFNSSLCDF